MPGSLLVWVDPEGRLRFLWDDELAGLAAHGRAEIRRASHVEPTASGEWTADLGPSGGPVLGPFRLRAEALDAERHWLEDGLSAAPIPTAESSLKRMGEHAART